MEEKLALGFEHHKAGRLKEAENLYKEVLHQDSNNHSALYLLGLICYQARNFLLAKDYIESAVVLSPDNPVYCKTLGDTYHALKDSDNALMAYSSALQLQPDNPELYISIGNVFLSLNNLAEALRYYKAALNTDPHSLQANFNAGIIYERSEAYDNAEYHYKKALELEPDRADICNNLANVYSNKGNHKEAKHYYEKAFALLPLEPSVQYNLGRTYLILEEFQKGWELFESRIKLFNNHNLKYSPESKPKWNGEPIEGKRIFAYTMSGIGDAIHFARYLPLISQRGAELTYKVNVDLESLFKQQDFRGTQLDFSAPEENLEFDYQIPFMSMGHAFSANRLNIPYKSGYIKADKNKTESYRQKYFNHNDFKIGLFWHASGVDKRAVDLSLFEDIVKTEGIRFYALQKGRGSEQIEQFSLKEKLVDLGNTFEDFSDTAAAIENLDLVISVDSSVAHLAGAMGKSCWLLLPHFPDWRWLAEGDKSYWYDSITLFRQAIPNDWSSSLYKIKRLLENNHANIAG